MPWEMICQYFVSWCSIPLSYPPDTADFAVPRLLDFSSLALIEMFVVNSREIVQLVLVLTAARMKSPCLARGTSAKTSSSMAVMVRPAGRGSIVTVAVVLIESGVNPALTSLLASVIEKHAARAAAISSYGLAPFPSSSPVPEYRLCERIPLPVVTRPFPRLRPQTQVAEAFGFM